MVVRIGFLSAAAIAAAVLSNGAVASGLPDGYTTTDPFMLSTNDGSAGGSAGQSVFLSDVVFGGGTSLDLAGHLGSAHSMSAADSLQLAIVTPISADAALWSGGEYSAATIPLAGVVDLQFGEAVGGNYRPQFVTPMLSKLSQLEAGRDASWIGNETALAGASWDFPSGTGLGVFALEGRQQNFLDGRLGLANPMTTTAVGVSAHLNLGSGWVTSFSYNEGITQLDLRPNAFTGDSSRRSAGYGLAIAKRGLFGDDSLGLAVTRPIQSESMDLQLVPFGEQTGGNNPLEGRVTLAGQTPETDLQLGYVTTFLDGALALQANAGYQMNLAGQNGTNAITVLSRAKINF